MTVEPRQKAYLQAIGIPLWVEKEPAVVSDQTIPDITPSNPITTLDWKALADKVKQCQDCPLNTTRKKTVFGSGPSQADIMIIGAAPNVEEDHQGQPFIGQVGQLLSNMLSAIGLERKQVYLANILKCHPPENRDPKPSEVSACNAYLNRQIDLIQPRLILSVGENSAKHLLQTQQTVNQLRGRMHQHPSTGIAVSVIYHPAHLLRCPEEKAKVWQDLQKAITYLKKNSLSIT